MTQAGPRVGQLYSCMEQSKMHGGNPRLTLPDSEDEVTLIRFRLDKNPDGALTSSTTAPQEVRVAGYPNGWRCCVARVSRSRSTGMLGAPPGSTLAATACRASRTEVQRLPSAARSAAGPSGTSYDWRRLASLFTNRVDHRLDSVL